MSIDTQKSMVSPREADNDLRDKYFREHITHISEADFWSAWKSGAPRLSEACRLGRTGKRKQAYLELAGFHREVTVPEWEQAVREAEGRTDTPQKRQELFFKATDVCRGLFNISGQAMHFGKLIDFGAHFGRNGVYNFNSLAWLVPLIDRFVICRKERDLIRILDIVEQFYRQRNGLSRPISRLHPVFYELGAWQKFTHLFPAYLAMLHAGTLQPNTIEVFMKLFLGCGRSLFRLSSTGYRHANWQVVGSRGLFQLGCVFPHLKEAAKWRKRALEMALEHIRRDFYSDGGPKERCWGYGWMAFLGILDCYESGRKSGFLKSATAAEWRRGIRRTFRWFLETILPTGLFPAYGDSDLFRGDDILAAARQYLPEAEFARRGKKSIILRPSGFAVMRDDASVDNRCLNLNFGESGGGHTHGDLLDFNLWAFGEPLIEEVGRFDSYDHPLNPFFKSPEAHNQVVLDHLSLDRHACEGKDVHWHSRPELDYFSAWHDGFRAQGVLWPMHMEKVARIRRHVLFVRHAYWLFYDVVEPMDGSADGASTIFSVSSYLHSPRPFRVLGPGLARLAGKGAGCVVAFAPAEDLRRLETGCDVSKAEVTTPRLYEERHFLRARAWGKTGYQGNIRMAMLIYPYRGPVPKVGIRRISMKGSSPGEAEAFEVRTPAGRDLVVFNPAKREGLAIGGKPIQGTLFLKRGRKKTIITL